MSNLGPHDDDGDSPVSPGGETHPRWSSMPAESPGAVSQNSVETPDPLDEPQRVDTRTPSQRWLASLKHYPGPGLLESCGWVAFFFVLQIGFALVVLLGMAVAFGARNQPAIEALMSERMDLFLGLTTFFTYLVLIPVGWRRLRPRTTLKLNLSPPTLAQFLLTLSLVMPLGSVADLLFTQGEAALELVLGEDLAQLREGTDVREALLQLQDAPLWTLILVVAVLPAVGEEFLFRAIIGRGLINRYGIMIGVLVTSFLFACVHLYPPHVLAILPVGIVIHFVYLSTRSYWMPMLFHFTNNALAVAALKFGVEDEPSAAMAALGAAYVVLGLYGLWTIRTRYVTESESSAAAPENDLLRDDEGLMFEQAVPVRGAESPPPGFPIDRRAPLAVGIAILATLMLTIQVSLLWAVFSAEPEPQAEPDAPAAVLAE